MRKKLFGLVIFMFGFCSNAIVYAQQNSLQTENEFQWDFSSPKKYVYSYLQEASNSVSFNKNDSLSKSLISVKGNLNIRVKENHMADLILETQMVTLDQKRQVIDTINNTEAANVIQNMKPNGTFGNNNHNPTFDLIFSLPSKNLKIGEKDKIPMEMPFNANGSILSIKGYNTIEFVGIQTIENIECAVLKSTFNISDLEIPEELNGIYEGSTIGNGTYFFDMKNHYFIGADIQINTKIKMDTESDKENDMGMFAHMQSVTNIKIDFITINP